MNSNPLIYKAKICHSIFFAILFILLLNGCSAVEYVGGVISRVKSPVTLNIPTVDKPLKKNEHDNLENFQDLTNKSTLFIVCISGGGERAARMGVYAMSMIESNYNLRAKEGTLGFVPLIDRIDAFSTVSGGSIYSSWVANICGSREKIKSFVQTNSAPIEPFQKRLVCEPFQILEESSLVKYDTKELGTISSISYLSPGNLFVEPLLEFFTEWDTLNQFADTHDLLQGQ